MPASSCAIQDATSLFNHLRTGTSWYLEFHAQDTFLLVFASACLSVGKPERQPSSAGHSLSREGQLQRRSCHGHRCRGQGASTQSDSRVHAALLNLLPTKWFIEEPRSIGSAMSRPRGTLGVHCSFVSPLSVTERALAMEWAPLLRWKNGKTQIPLQKNGTIAIIARGLASFDYISSHTIRLT